MRTPNVAEQIRASREVKSNRDTDEVDRVKSKQTVEDSGQSGVDKVKPQAYHSLPSSPVSDVPAQSASRFLSIELQMLSFSRNFTKNLLREISNRAIMFT